MRGWLRVFLAVSGVVLMAAAGLVWWSAERALGAAPEVVSSPRGGLSWCAYERVGQLTCDPPQLTGGTVTVIVAFGGLGAASAAAAAASLLRRRRSASEDGHRH
ncbi:hypothetical protein SAMN05421837_102233 [Amycolatopsis pretoriensis]|uniref:Uncharacterized protein n=1 Tax=Amycolatopsis pretoriensis TaxID=218821 RepID=A0A1H5QBU6_9PSEU|nr:hypothetical protein [Amycolatopsis pretoriensis]SEF23535.1 hypothetical protein SAMN05421837_102233 [Amycolatopsis pretoriensis]